MWSFLTGWYTRSMVNRHGIRTVERVFWGIVLWFIGLFLWAFLWGYVISPLFLPASWLPDDIPWALAAYWVVTAIVLAQRYGD